MSFDSLLTQRGRLEHAATEDVSTSGARVPTWTTVATSLPCLVSPIRQPAAMAQGVLEGVTHTVFIGYRSDIVNTPLDRWRIIVEGITYEIAEPGNPGGRDHHLELRVRRMEGP